MTLNYGGPGIVARQLIPLIICFLEIKDHHLGPLSGKSTGAIILGFLRCFGRRWNGINLKIEINGYMSGKAIQLFGAKLGFSEIGL
jgi:hypothetical protein